MKCYNKLERWYLNLERANIWNVMKYIKNKREIRFIGENNLPTKWSYVFRYPGTIGHNFCDPRGLTDIMQKHGIFGGKRYYFFNCCYSNPDLFDTMMELKSRNSEEGWRSFIGSKGQDMRTSLATHYDIVLDMDRNKEKGGTIDDARNLTLKLIKY